MDFDLSEAIIVDSGRSKCFDCAREIRSCEWMCFNKAVPGSHICIRQIKSVYTKHAGYIQPHPVYCVTSCPKYLPPLLQQKTNNGYEERQRRRGNTALRCYPERKNTKHLSLSEKADQKAVKQLLQELEDGKSSPAKLRFVKEYYFKKSPDTIQSLAKTIGSTPYTVRSWSAEIPVLVGYYANVFEQDAKREGYAQ